jgi:hypothetical protein
MYKYIFLIWSVLLPPAISKPTYREAHFVVHEWGTFTTLSDSSGRLLDSLRLDKEPLPNFVYQYNLLKPSEDVLRYKGLSYIPRHVNVRMETPVIYFYSPLPLHVAIRVDFPRGLISQWYPNCSKGNKPLPENAALDFARPVHGFMEWQANILAPDSRRKPTETTDSHTWNTPRQTDANFVEIPAQAEIEKFIFYRGVANFLPPISAKYVNHKLTISNTGKNDLSFVFVYYNTGHGTPWSPWEGTIGTGKSQEVNMQQYHPPADLGQFRAALVNAGLYEKEAIALLETWTQGYFKTPGLRIFWIAPTDWTNEILPLHITPQPAVTNRVFVGRYDFML